MALPGFSFASYVPINNSDVDINNAIMPVEV
jgi:hypothetical protein